jgi:hypothetical protein
MRYQEFELNEDELFELKMSPTNLARMAKNIDARAGMEFELIVPGVEDQEQEYESEPDYDMDESFPTGPGWTRDVISFFRGGDMGNSTSYIQRAIDSLNEDFYAWIGDDQEEFINSVEGRDRAVELAADSVDRADYESDDEYRDAVLQYADENEGDIRDQLIDEYNDDLDSKFVEWLDDQGINSMVDFANEYNLDWPYWTEQDYDGGGGASIDAVADDFSQAIGRPVNAASSYHSGRREAGHYVVEPDGSLQGDRGETGLEFVSPVLTVPEMLEDIDKVAKWASRAGAYTNNSTGLHMNVSVPDQQNLDYVKLAMFLGDEYILKQFGRAGNTYCKSALDKIKKTARSNPDRVEEMMRQFQNGLNQLASKMIHTGSTEKFTSINNRDGWIEFRGPGGDWLGSDLGPVKNTLLRTVVALDVATKPEEFKQEYYKKLYKTLQNPVEFTGDRGKRQQRVDKDTDDAISVFAKYAAGELPTSALKSFIRQIQTQREIGKEKSGPAQGQTDVPFVWRVIGDPDSPYQSQGTEVVASTAAEAKAAAVRQWRLNTSPRSVEEFTQQWTATPLRPAPAETSGRDQEFAGWEVVSRASDEVVHTFDGRFMTDPRSVAEAESIAAEWRRRAFFDGAVYVRPRMQAAQPVAGSTQDLQRQRLAAQMPRLEIEDGNWEIYSISSGNGIYRFAANTEEEAVRAFDIWQDAVRAPGLPREGFNLRTVQPMSSTGQPTPAGSVGQQTYRVTYTIMDDQGTSMHDTSVQARNADAAMAQVRQALQARGQTPEYISADPLISTSTPARGTESLPPGNARWLVLDRDDREVYSFVNTTAQSDANQYARDWMINRAPREVRDRGPFTIVPAR